MTAPVSQVLSEAADLLEKPGAWTTGVCARDAQSNVTGWSKDNAACFCALGAIFRAGNGVDTKADDFFGKSLGGIGWAAIPVFNDAPDRQQTEVVDALRRAAALAKEQGR